MLCQSDACVGEVVDAPTAQGKARSLVLLAVPAMEAVIVRATTTTPPTPKRNKMGNKEWVEGQTEAYPGWASIIRYIDKQLSDIDPDYKVLQIKEKFGGLRYYYVTDHQNYKEMQKIVTDAENESFRTCDNCGTKENVETKPNDRGWVRTLCGECRNKEE